MATNVLPPLVLGTEGLEKVGHGRERSRPKPVSPKGNVVERRGKRDREGTRDQRKPLFKDMDPSRYRNSTFHNICTDMLEEGYHQSFAELFTLVEQQRSDHDRAGPAVILLAPLIENSITKLEYLKQHLTSAEEAGRAGDMDAVYMAQRSMAQYFEQTKDTWLSDHFYNRCLETGVQIKGDNRRKEGEAHCHVGLSLENRGDLQKAARHLEMFHQLSHKHKWHTDSGDSLYEIACEHLRRVYTSSAEEVQSESPKTAISYLKKALEVAKEGGDSYQEGLACYRLGNAYESTGEHDKAIQYHKSFLEGCKFHGDDAGVGSAYEALARSYESKGDIENAVKFLEMYVSVTEKAGLQNALAKACSAIGTMCNTLGDYDKAVEYFGRTYDICSKMKDPEALHSARVQYGIAKGHQSMKTFSSSVNDLSERSMQRLLIWKHTRTDDNDDDDVSGPQDGDDSGKDEDNQSDVVASAQTTDETGD